VSFRTRLRGSLPYAVAIIGGFLIAYLIVAFVIFPSGVIPGEAKVPNVTGVLYDDAVKRLAEVGFKAERGESRFHAASPKETVLEQVPIAGTRDAEGTTVTLVTSAGQQVVSVPAVVGLTQSDAQSALEGAGFELGTITERPSKAPQGQVVASDPAPGAKAAIPSSVAVVISAGSTVVLVPNVVGRSMADAKQMLERAGLRTGDMSGATTAGKATVASQRPAAGAQVAVDSPVALQIAAPGARPK
jgi:beta-lactam-binding protein with PASTA domain